MIKYTFTFNKLQEQRFKQILQRLEPEEYNILEVITPIDTDNPRHSDLQTVIEMDSECALTFRMAMKDLKIRRERTEEELAIEKERDEKNKISSRIFRSRRDLTKYSSRLGFSDLVSSSRFKQTCSPLSP